MDGNMILRQYFLIGEQIAQVSLPMLFKWVKILFTFEIC